MLEQPGRCKMSCAHTIPAPIDYWGADVIRILTDQNPFAHSLRPMDMIRHGWLSSFRQASQQ
jgi:hypothetical protein